MASLDVAYFYLPAHPLSPELKCLHYTVSVYGFLPFIFVLFFLFHLLTTFVAVCPPRRCLRLALLARRRCILFRPLWRVFVLKFIIYCIYTCVYFTGVSFLPAYLLFSRVHATTSSQVLFILFHRLPFLVMMSVYLPFLRLLSRFPFSFLGAASLPFCALFPPFYSAPSALQMDRPSVYII